MRELPQLDPAAADWLTNPSASRTRVTRGLAASWLAVVVILFASAVPIVPWGAPELGWPSAAVFLALRVVAAASLAVKVAGALSCLATPEQSNGRVPVQIAATAALIATFLRISALLAERGVLRPIDLPIDLLASLLDAAWAAFFLVYLKRLALFIGQADLIRWFVPFLVGVVAVALLGLPLPSLTFGMRPRSDFVYYCVGCVRAIQFYGEFVVYIFYAALIWRIRRAIVAGKG